MRIINLTVNQFRNYANLHSSRNIGQTYEYTRLKENQPKEKLFLGLIDNKEIIHAAVCIIINNISPIVKEGIAKDGFLIDYSNFSLVETFTKELTKYLKKAKITYLSVDPMFVKCIYDRKDRIIENNGNVLDNLIRLDYQNLGYTNEFEKYDVVIENYNSTSDIYKNFNRNTKRNIKESMEMGITLHKGSEKDLETFYEMVKKKKNLNINYYRDLLETYNTKNNKMEIFFTKLNVNRFLINSKKLYDKAKEKNEKINKKLQNIKNNINDSLYNKKLESDKTVNKYHHYLEMANKIGINNEKEITIATTAIIRNNKEVYFLIDGYNDKYRYIHSSHTLKWAIIEKYYKLGYNKFNLGEIHNTYFSKSNKYHGQYLYKMGFGGKIVEYPPHLRLIINKPVYSAYQQLNKITKKSEK